MRYHFGSCIVDADRRRVFRGGLEVHVSPRGLALLLALLDGRPRALSKDHLLETLWPGTFVSETNLPTLVNEIRHAIGDARPWRHLRTVHGYGYAFDGAVRVDEECTGPPARRPRWALVGKTGEMPVPEGEHVIGRGRDAQIVVEGALVSRRHAVVIASGGTLAIQDLGSRNGTLIGTAPVVGRRALVNRDVVWIGPHAFRVVDLEAVEETLGTGTAS